MTKRGRIFHPLVLADKQQVNDTRIQMCLFVYNYWIISFMGSSSSKINWSEKPSQIQKRPLASRCRKALVLVITSWDLYKFLCFSWCLCVLICVWIDYDWVGARVLECLCEPCERQRVLNMCWRSQTNSGALIRTSAGRQLVNSVYRIGVLYPRTKECKLAPVPSGHWERIHMALTALSSIALRPAPQCNFPQSKGKQAGLMARPTRTAVYQARVVTLGSFSAMTTKSLLQPKAHVNKTKHFIL